MQNLQSLKPTIKNLTANDSRKLCSFSTSHPTIGELTLAVKKLNDNYDNFESKITNQFGKSLGTEIFSIHQNTPLMRGLKIEVNPEYRQKSFRLGELLRLGSIIEIMENKFIDCLEIFSKNTAIFFHSKYKFEPCIKSFYDRDAILRNISIENYKGFEDLTEEANVLLEKPRFYLEPNQERELCSKTSQLLKKFITRALKNPNAQQDYQFDKGFDMVLTKRNILENKDFFNNLFKKHNIDYEI